MRILTTDLPRNSYTSLFLIIGQRLKSHDLIGVFLFIFGRSTELKGKENQYYFKKGPQTKKEECA